MDFETPLLRGRLIKRYKRFLADIELPDGETITATCPNTGSMKGLTTPGSTVWLSTSDSPTRKYRHTWELVEHDLGKGPTVVGINTNHPNKLVTEAIEAGRIAPLKGYGSLRREVKYGSENSRIDILMEDARKGTCYVEVKNVHLRRTGDWAEFPDSVTARGTRHLGDLQAVAARGARAVMLYLVQRTDCARFRLAADLDPAYAAAFDAARAHGVEALCYGTAISETGVRLGDRLPVSPAPQARSG